MNDAGESILTFSEGTHVHTLWFVGDGQTKDWMGVVFREADGVWQGKYRFRYYNSPDPFDLTDKKSTVHVLLKRDGNVGEIIAAFDHASALALEWMGDGAQRWMLHIDGDVRRLLTLLAKQEWAHIRMQAVSPEKPQ